jgi:hypothetical protein
MPTIEYDYDIGYYYENDLQWWKDSYIYFSGDNEFGLPPKKTTSGLKSYIKWVISIITFKYFYRDI